MPSIVHLTPDFAVAAALEPADVALLQRQGFDRLIDLIPDAEAGLVRRVKLAEEARRYGLSHAHNPAGAYELFTDEVVEPMALLLSVGANGKTLATCKSGVRAAIVWAAASARFRPVGEILQQLEAAGFDLEFIRDDLDSQADRMRWASPEPRAPALGPAAAASHANRKVAKVA